MDYIPACSERYGALNTTSNHRPHLLLREELKDKKHETQLSVTIGVVQLGVNMCVCV